MAYPTSGTYSSEDGGFSFEITSADSTNGQIVAEYKAKKSPVGSVDVSGTIGHYAFVVPGGVPPFAVRFGVGQRPDGRPYALFDSWTGAYLEGEIMQLQGSRSIVTKEGDVKVSSLGTRRFSK